jgi:hypothetical protein
VGPVLFEQEILYGKGESKCKYTIVRTWTATDGCGNTAFAQQLIEVEDTEAPDFDCKPFTIKVACGDVPALDECAASDNCDDDLDITFNETSTVNVNGSVLHVRTWTATDDCGNTTVLEQSILEACDKLGTAQVYRVSAAPNPFAGETRITFGSAVAGNVVLDVLAPDGRLNTQLYRGALASGEERTVIFTENDLGFGSYLVRLSGPAGVAHGRLTSTR